MSEKNKNPVLLHNWRLAIFRRGGLRIFRLLGEVYGHTIHKNGEMIMPSSPKTLEKSSDGSIILVTKTGSRYQLGDSHPECNAKLHEGYLREAVENNGWEVLR